MPDPKTDLTKKIQSLRDQLDAATKSLNQILIEEFPIKIGTVVVHCGKRYSISAVRIKYGDPRAWGRKFLKYGSLGVREFEMYGKIEVVKESK